MSDADKIVRAIQGLTDATSYSVWTYFLAMLLNLAPVFLGGWVAYFFTNRHWERVNEKEDVSKKATEICNLVNELQKGAIEYWMASSSSTDRTQLTILEIQLKTQTPILVRLAKQFESSAQSDDGTLRALQKIDSELYELVTGDDFESRPKEPDAGKATKIANLLTKAGLKISGYCNRGVEAN